MLILCHCNTDENVSSNCKFIFWLYELGYHKPMLTLIAGIKIINLLSFKKRLICEVKEM